VFPDIVEEARNVSRWDIPSAAPPAVRETASAWRYFGAPGESSARRSNISTMGKGICAIDPAAVTAPPGFRPDFAARRVTPGRACIAKN